MKVATIMTVLVIAILVLIFLVGLIAQVVIVKANMIISSSVEIKSPNNYEVYQTSTIDISVVVTVIGSAPDVTSISYSLDDKPNVSLSILKESNVEYLGTGTLENLADGYHSLSAYFHIPYFKDKSTSTTFLVNTTGLRSPSPPSTTTPLTSSNPALTSNSVPNTIFIAAVLFVLGLFAITAAFVIYIRRKPKTSG